MQENVYTREASRKSVSLVSDGDDLSADEKISTKKSPRKSKKPSSRGRKKGATEVEEIPKNKLDIKSDEGAGNLTSGEDDNPTSGEDDNLSSDEDNPSKKTRRKSRKKGLHPTLF